MGNLVAGLLIPKSPALVHKVAGSLEREVSRLLPLRPVGLRAFLVSTATYLIASLLTEGR